MFERHPIAYTNGGARPGSGRKKGSKMPSTLLAGEARERTIRKVMEHWDEIIETKLELALGDYYVEKKVTDKAGHERRKIYKGMPHPTALQDVIEMVQGKAVQAVSMQAEINGTIEQPGLTDLANSIKAILERRNK